MLSRLLLPCLVSLAVLSTQAATKAPAKTAPGEGLELTAPALLAGIKQHLPEEQDCRTVTFQKPRTFKNGAVIKQKLERDGAEIDMTFDIAKSGKLANARFAADTKDPAHLTVMLCATYAAMRTLQPTMERSELARQAALELWQQAQQQTITKTFAGERFRAQMAPFEVNVF
ncbi:hypothetical protein [Pseudomonas japonica]|uniref:hypothetical protein n=1 Tax=Pseudomonas japonica TaxID=256466 RepID=UPI0015E3002B|nr:hypothetical protein [Pseudomonas japonica]MBA1243343.1 hypothetical protein [Pseudomonas japonica]